MKEFRVEIIENFEITLLKPQIDIIFKCLQYYAYNVYTINGKIKYEAQNSEMSLIRDTYNQINNQLYTLNKNKKSKTNNNVKKIFTKLA